MSCKSTITKMKRIARTIEKYRALREKLKKEGRWAELARLPRDSSPTRYRNYCELTGRSRGVYRKLRISRIKLRELALEGKISGMKKASW